ncbi:hypothetical protein OS493_012060 [Desmophyllum pertusum]|uniref:Uncharacterized protein n=1 Tax=Desmophyllum pertusum TaxID=174260 RepID=A0A9X0DB95_9CNID|nr:hypothetical protein OS493_012060 [Desmophyllum pertusum]
MDLIYPDTSFCESSFSLLDSLNGAKSMALEDELCPENVQELLKLLSCIKNNTNEAQVESCMSLLAEGLDEEEDVDRLETEQAHCTVQSAMRDYKTSYKNSTTRLLCALQTHGA